MVVKSTGTVKGGVIIPSEGVRFPEGTQVEISADVEVAGSLQAPVLAEIIDEFAGKVTGHPPDFSKNHDHYLYGTPRK